LRCESEQTNKQSDRHTYTLIAIFRTPTRGDAIINHWQNANSKRLGAGVCRCRYYIGHFEHSL